MKYLLLALLLVGCGSEESYPTIQPEQEYIDDNYTRIRHVGQVEMCAELPESIFCENSPSVGDIQPTKEYRLYLKRDICRIAIPISFA